MKKLKIKEINTYDYLLTDGNNEYKLNLELYNTNIKLEVEDVIYMDKSLIKENVMYSFGTLNSIYSKKLLNDDSKEIIAVIKGKEKYYLQRYYG